MRTPFLRFLLVAGCTATLVMPGLAASPASKSEIARIVAEAATYQPGQSREPFRRLEDLLRDSSSGTRSQLEAGLVRLLEPSATYEAHKFACTQLGIIGSKKALPALATLLNGNETAGIACLALTTYPPGKTDDVLRAALASAQGMARVQIINTLGDRRDAKAVKLLTPLTNDADTSVARAALVALGKIAGRVRWKIVLNVPEQDRSALDAALKEIALRGAEAEAASGGAKVAVPLYENLLAPSQPDYVRRAALNALLRLDKDHAQQRILQVLSGSDAALKPVAIAGVRLLPPGTASEVFAAQLPNLPAQEQVWLIDSLAGRGDVAASTAIGNSLASTNGAVRRAAIDHLGRVGDAWCVPLFARALPRCQDAEEHRALNSALVSLPGGGITDRAIITALNKSAGNTSADLISALARRQGPAANTLLLTEANRSESAAAKAALRALARTAEAKDAGALLQRLTTAREAEVRAEAASAAMHALAQFNKPGRRSELVCQALRWPQSLESRIAVLGLLPVCGDAAALAALEYATADADSTVREAAVRALADWPDAAAWDAIARVYHQPGRGPLRGLALRGLVRLAGEANAHADAKLIERYRQLLADAQTDADLRLILGALGGAAQPGALDLALPFLGRTGVRAEAEVAVKRIAEAIKAKYPQAAEAALKRVQPAAKAQ